MKPKSLEEIFNSNDMSLIKSTFCFDNEDNDYILLKFGLWGRYFFPKYFESEDAPFHKEMDLCNIKAYKGELSSFVNIQFRGSGKTSRTKLFLAFCICNDLLRRRKYIKVLSDDGNNSRQIVTDIYNMLVDVDVARFYPEIFQKTNQKREETMSSFTASFGVKIVAGTVGTSQRGALQDNARPDFIWFEDIEDRLTLRSAIKTKAIWDNMEEARTGLAKGGSCIYTCNYISERGNVHKLVTKKSDTKVVMIVPILKDDGLPTWDRFSVEEIEIMKQQDDDFEGERMCKPSAGKDVMFDREILEMQPKRPPIRSLLGLDFYRTYDPSHRYALGADVAGGVGLDSSTTVIIDFSTIPAQVVGTYANNTIKPDIFGDEIVRQAEYFGECLVAPEKNNHGVATIARLKQIYSHRKIYQTEGKQTFIVDETEPKEFGWHTNGLTKPKMMFDLVKAVNDGLLLLVSEDLIAECKSYTRDDLMDSQIDPRLTTRHFDLLIACAIAWQMKDHAHIPSVVQDRRDKYQKLLDEIDFDPHAVI